VLLILINQGGYAMKRLTALLSIVLFVFACNNYKKVTETETFVITDDFKTLYVEVTAGNIDINSSTDNGSDNSTNIDVIAEKFAYGFNESDAEENLDKIEIETELDGDTYKVIVKTPYDDTGFDPFFAGGADLTFNNANGKEVIIISTAGNIECDDIEGGQIDATAGNIDIGSSAGDIEIGATAGHITVGSVRGDVTVNNTAGNITVEDFSGALFDIAATAGNIVVEVMREGAVDGSALSTAGNIDLTLSDELSCKVELAATAGAIDINGVSEYDRDVNIGGVNIEASFTLNAGEGKITAETTAGSIKVDVD